MVNAGFWVVCRGTVVGEKEEIYDDGRSGVDSRIMHTMGYPRQTMQMRLKSYFLQSPRCHILSYAVVVEHPNHHTGL